MGIGKMVVWLCAAAAWLATSMASAAPDAAYEHCEGVDFLGPLATLVMKRAYVDKRGNYIGVFEFHNYNLGPAVELLGNFEGKRLMVTPRDTRIEYRDLNRTWTSLLLGPISHYFKPPDKVVVKPRASVLVKAYLFPKTFVQNEGSEFTLKLYTDKPRQCVVSLPFKAIRARAPIQGFVSDPVPPMPWSFPGHDGDAKPR